MNLQHKLFTRLFITRFMLVFVFTVLAISFFSSTVAEAASRRATEACNGVREYSRAEKEACAYGWDQAAANRNYENRCRDRYDGDREASCIGGGALQVSTRASSSGGSGNTSSFFGTPDGGHLCGNTDNAVKTKFNFGCLGDSYTQGDLGPIEDLLYALIRFMSVGVGIVLVGAIIISGIQYSTSEGNPETTVAAKNRIQSVVAGLIIYIFAFSLLQYLVPGGIFNV
jgi:hypothetical protein